ncbi:hypothetical protein ACH4ZU_19215 [Streptomyces sp. NPDC020472]|uniref:hypothetical protein n=1 Tax=Streptomyces sp. NPDC020472 TaxID=3365075 RepID=UPI0037A447AF
MIGTLIALLGLVVSVATAVVGYRHGHRAERAQQIRDEREEQSRRQREEEAERAARIRQASWISVHPEAGGRGVAVYNGSSQPVSDLRVLVDGDVLRPDRVRLLTPGEYARFVPSADATGRDLDPAAMAAEFTDVAGRTWRRTAEGTLYERVSPEGAPPRWGPPTAPLVEPYRSPHTESRREDTGAGHGIPETERPAGPPSGPLGGSTSPVPPPSAPRAGGGGRGRGGSWSPLFVLGCLGAVAALAYLVARLV